MNENISLGIKILRMLWPMPFDGKWFEEKLMSFYQKNIKSSLLSSLTLHQTFTAHKNTNDKKELWRVNASYQNGWHLTVSTFYIQMFKTTFSLLTTCREGFLIAIHMISKSASLTLVTFNQIRSSLKCGLNRKLVSFVLVSAVSSILIITFDR